MTATLLDPVRVVTTLEQLHTRIEERFPTSGLSRVCGEIIDLAGKTARRAASLGRPNWPLRLGVFIVLAVGVAAQLFAASLLHVEGEPLGPTDLVQGLEATVNLLILFGGAIWFLLSLEERFKRRRALDELNQFRALAHVIDMHQLTKDPTIVLQPHLQTKASPQRAMTQFELTRYLDYCAEMLALLGKLAALYGNHTRDDVVIGAINDIETLTGNLGRKIWQKITILSALAEDHPAPT
jgi:hypothetical protein